MVGVFRNALHQNLKYGLNPDDMTALDNAETKLNATIQSQVSVAKSAGINIQYVASQSDFAGHGPCDTTPPSAQWINGLMWQGSFLWDKSVYSFHPTAAGQQEFSRLILAQL